MKKISILSISLLLVGLLFVLVLHAKSQTRAKSPNSLVVKLNGDKSIQQIKVVFTRNLTSDSLQVLKRRLEDYGITVRYKKLEFNKKGRLSSICCDVICRNGYKGTLDVSLINAKNEKSGFVCDFTKEALGEEPFEIGSDEL